MARQRNDAPVAAIVLSGQIGGPRSVKSINHVALAITRSLGRQGVRVYRFHPNTMLYDLSSRYCLHVPCPNLYVDEPGLLSALRDFCRRQRQRPVVFPTSDGSAGFLSRHAEALGGCCRAVVAPARCVADVQDKGELYRLAARAGVAAPRTFEPADEDQARAAAAAMDYPAVIKPLTSQQWRAAGVVEVLRGVKAIEVDSPESLLAAYRRAAALTPRLMIQEIVPGPDDRLLTFLGYFDRRGRPLAGCVRKKLRQCPPRFGYCCLTETVRDAETMASAIRLLSALGYSGIGCVEFKRDPRDGLLKLIEINTRAVRTTGLAIGAGVDLPYIAYRDMVGLPVRPCFRYRVGMRWVHLTDEVSAARELIAAGKLTLGQWLAVFRAPLVEAEWALDDPSPFVGRTARWTGRLLASALRKPLLARAVACLDPLAFAATAWIARLRASWRRSAPAGPSADKPSPPRRQRRRERQTVKTR